MNPFFVTSKIDRSIRFSGNEFLYFSGTAYLGMGSLPEFEEMIIAGIQLYGPNYGASRFSNVQLAVYEEMETYFAIQAEAEKAVVMSSGFLAGYVTASVLNKMADEVWVAPDTHPAILPDGLRPDPSQTFGQFHEKCVEASHKVGGRNIAILANAVDPLKPAIHHFDWVRELSAQNTYYLLIDDSHAFGLIGKSIFGTYSQWKNLPVHLVITGSLGKALGIPAGIILGPSSFIEKITSNPVFIGASPPAPGFCKAFLGAQKLYIRRQENLQKNLSYFFSQAKAIGEFNFQEHLPIATFKSSGWAERLKEKQILISSFPYPDPRDIPMDRIIISAYHTKEDLNYLMNSLMALSKLPI